MTKLTAAQVTAAIEEMAPLHYQETYDNAGFCVGRPQAEVTGTLLCVDVTETILDEAIQSGTNLIISHHPVIFKGLKHLTGDTRTERIVEKAVKNNLILYAAHTNIDNVRGGVSEAMAEKLQLRHRQILSPKGDDNIGFGILGELPASFPAKDFLQCIRTAFHTPCIRYSQPPERVITRIAVCGGSGAFLLHDAMAAGATAFISADFKYHDFFDAGARLLIADIGHYESEKDVLGIFYHCLTKKIPNFAVRLTKNDTNAINYF
jgi:dinuclear metal center YbgI/SA1388 family protein